LSTLTKLIRRLVRSERTRAERRCVDRRAVDRRLLEYGPVGHLWGADRRWHGERRSGRDRRLARIDLSV
jgi:hypothetical protein